MENQVIMSLEDYTKLITENALLKSKMQNLKQRAEIQIQDDIKTNFINSLPKDKVVSYLEEKNHDKVLNDLSSYNSSWHWESLANQHLIVTAQEAKEMAYSLIARCLETRLFDINSEEEKQ